ncbi:hypothetical protein [Streptomyces sp. NBC_00102]|uniref:hypothetical protein n=1 Tax=Streptomyces sp. NBC_00102 TaxID=2975652 RepID=UPI002254CDD1|nr:hypothetical protein [Streptomyces sp. NBC_00102]MCX5399496.1 hypothetical protein [Streptomyces sp. NBC_00102]
MTLTRGARITGTALSAVLALITAGWIVRDLRALGGPGPLWDFWSGVPERFPGAVPTTTGGALVLLVVQAATAFAVRRSPAAAPALVATGVTTLLLRLPGVWIIGASWMDGRYPDELRTRALISTFVTLAVSIAMIVTAAAGRRPARETGLPAPVRPASGPAVTAFLTLGSSGAVLIAWEIRQLFIYPDEVYPDWYLGGRVVGAMLVDVPAGWSTAGVALLALFAAAAGLARAAHSRPFGTVAAAFLVFSGGLGIARGVRLDLFQDYSGLGTEGQLALLSWVFLALAGIAALIATARRGVPAEDGQGWGPGAPGYGYPPPGAPGRAPGYGYPYPSSFPGPDSGYPSTPGTPYSPASGSSYPGAPGYGYPPAGQGSGQDAAEEPGYGHPQGGGFGPPPPSSPPPGW